MREVVLVISAIPLGVIGFMFGARLVRRERRAVRREVFAVSFPRGVDAPDVEAFVRTLAGLLPPRWQRSFGLPSVVFEVHATHSVVTFRLHVEESSRDFVLEQLRLAIPAVRIERLDAVPFEPTLAAELRLSDSRRELRVDRAANVSAALLAALRPLEKSEEILLQWVISPSAPDRNNDWRRFLTGSSAGKQDPKPDKSMRAKGEGPHFLINGRIGVRAATPERSRQLLRRELGVFHILNAPGVSFRHRAVPSEIVARRMTAARPSLISFPVVLNARELTAILAIPMGEISIAGLELGRSRILAASPKLPERGPVFAMSNAPGRNRSLTYSLSSLPYHAWVIGGTGSGKSTLLANLIAEYMNLGATIVVMDSKRDLVRDAIELIPEHRIGDLVLLDPADDRPAGFNLLPKCADDIERSVDQLVGAFTLLWPGYVGPRSQDLLRASLLTLSKTPGNTFVELSLLLTSDAFRQKLVGRVDDPIVLEPLWAAFDAASRGDRAQQIAPLMNKIRALTARRALRDMIGQADGLDIEEVLSRPSILMVPLSKGLIGDDAANLLGSIVLMRCWNALMTRIGMATTSRSPVLLVLDEFADYMRMPLSFGDMLAQARALGVGVVAAHQHMLQLPPALRADLHANARTKIAFQLSSLDARGFAAEMAPHLDAEDLQGLGRYEIAAQICVDGEVLPPATGTTLPPPQSTGAGARARELSRQRFGRDRADIDAEIRVRHAEIAGGGDVGRRRRP